MRDRDDNPLRTVWVLGAGFSKSLGGPLLCDLFRQRQIDDLREQYPRHGYDTLADDCWWTQVIFNFGRVHEQLWQDAESFVDAVDSCTKQSHRAAALLRLSERAAPLDANGGRVVPDQQPPRPASIQALRTAVVRCLAAECSSFVEDRAIRRERWLPYESWRESLDPSLDTIVTFNYDHVVESISGSTPIHACMPSENRRPPDASVPLLKLHGSVTWLLEAQDTCATQTVREILGGYHGEPAIGIPGKSKHEMQREVFEPLWLRAEQAIINAQAIVFIGYRFPESDGTARFRLLKAIQGNTSDHLRVQLILGPNTSHPDTVRARRMLEVCTRRNREVLVDKHFQNGSAVNKRRIEVYADPLLAEDFLALSGKGGPLSTWL